MTRKKNIILIIEDEDSLRDVLGDKLVSSGFTVLSADNGEDGLALALEKHPQLIILDIMMPKMNGMRVLRALRDDNWGRNVPVIVLTNVSEVKTVIEAFEYGESSTNVLPSQLPTRVVPATTETMKRYLAARLKIGVDDILMKSGISLERIVSLIKDRLKSG